MKSYPFLPAFLLLTLPLLPATRADEPPTGPVFCRYVPERKDDFAWENDLVAFRVYGPALKGSVEHENSGVDCWFKRTKTPIIDKWYGGEGRGISYHQDHGEGYDGYHVGSSRGCGGTALWRDGKMVLSGVYTSQKILSQTPDEATFELTYDYPPDANGAVIHETKDITIKAHEHFFRSTSTFTRGGQPAEVDVAVGVTTHDDRADLLSSFDGWIMCWETIDGQGVGTGACMIRPRVTKIDQITAPSQPDESHILMLTRTGPDGKEEHLAGFAWAGAGEITTKTEWEKLLTSALASAR